MKLLLPPTSISPVSRCRPVATLLLSSRGRETAANKHRWAPKRRALQKSSAPHDGLRPRRPRPRPRVDARRDPRRGGPARRLGRGPAEPGAAEDAGRRALGRPDAPRVAGRADQPDALPGARHRRRLRGRGDARPRPAAREPLAAPGVGRRRRAALASRRRAGRGGPPQDTRARGGGLAAQEK